MSQNTPPASSHSPPQPHQNPTTLILVCCHAIFIGPSSTSPLKSLSPTQSSSRQNIQLNPYDPTQWLLQPFQATEAPTFMEHIRTGLNLLQADPASILVFSGGRTRSGQGCEVSEAEGYARVARWLLLNDKETKSDRESGAGNEVVQNSMGRVYFEEYATDSFQNVLFALLGWSIWSTRSQSQLHSNGSVASSTGLDFPNLPSRLIIVSHAFKQARFMELHLPAIRELLGEKGRQGFERMEVEYVGIDPPFSEKERREVEEGERVRGYEPWVEDRFGTGKILDGKRKARGWDGGVGYLEWWREQLGVNGRRKEDVQEVVRQVERIINGRAIGGEHGTSKEIRRTPFSA